MDVEYLTYGFEIEKYWNVSLVLTKVGLSVYFNTFHCVCQIFEKRPQKSFIFLYVYSFIFLPRNRV